jgi:tetratricopeptide (TPR) repeat protein
MTTPLSFEKPFKQISDTVAFLREKKGGGKEALKLIEEAISVAQDFVVSLLLEKHLVYQHEAMEELAKPEGKQDKRRKRVALVKMEAATREAEAYVRINSLTRWTSRANRCLGRVEDYKGNYKKAARHYRKAIKFVKKDPEYLREKVPRWLEYESFLAYSTMMGGDIKKGLVLAKKAFEKFDKTIGRKLRNKDFPTWAIWKSGIPIRMIDGLIQKNERFDKDEMLGWLLEAEEIIKVPKASKKWLGKVDFGFRKDEVTALRRKLEDSSA